MNAVTKKVALIFDNDSQYFACRNYIRSFEKEGWIVFLVSIGGRIDFSASDFESGAYS